MALIKKSAEYSWVKYIKTRIKNKRNMLILNSGPTGSGKSWAGISIACMLDKNFSPKQIIFGFDDLMDLIEGGEKYPIGTCFVWDEFQIDASSRDWRSLTNRLLNQLLTTFRHRQFILIITSPFSDFIDSQARKLLHAEFEMKKIDYKTKECKIKPMVLQYNSRNKKTYHKFLRIKGEYSPKTIEWWNIPKPPQWIIDEYEHKKSLFTTALNKDIRFQLKNIKKLDERSPLTKKQEFVMNELSKGELIENIAKKMNISIRSCYVHKNLAEKKGYSVEQIGKKGAKQQSKPN